MWWHYLTAGTLWGLAICVYSLLTFASIVSKLNRRCDQFCTIYINIIYICIFAYIYLLSVHPLCGGGDLLFLLSPPAAAATCFCSSTRIISKYLQYAYWPWEICPVTFFRPFSASSTKSKMAAKILCRSIELEPLYGFVS